MLGKLWRFFISLGAPILPHGQHVTRYMMYRALQSVPLSTEGKSVLSISHSVYLCHLLGFKDGQITEANYPEHNAANLCRFADGSFDFIISDQVLEHVEGNPQAVFAESLRLLKSNGVAIHTTCFINPVHGWPSDFWRFTPAALKLLARSFSEVIQIGAFGNRMVWIVDLLGIRSMPVPHLRWHPLHVIATRNNPLWPVTTWIVARK